MAYKIKLTPRSEREAIIAKRAEASTETEWLYDFRGEKAALKIVTVPVDFPVYRMDNCRTFSEQQDAIAKEGHDPSYFAKGQELSSVQAIQHGILSKLAKRETTAVSPILDVLEKEGQRGPILITSTGVVVNGNRRLSAIRELYADEDSIASRWAHVKCAVLPADTSPDEVDDIEANEQARPQTKLEYDWIGDARLVKHQINKGRTSKQVADQLRRDKTDIENLVLALGEAELYLNEWAKKPGQFSLVSGDAEQIFGDLPKRLVGKSMPLQDASRVIAWSLFDNRKKLPVRVYAFNSAFGAHAEEVLKGVAEQLDLSDSPIDVADATEDFSIEIDTPQVDYSAVISALRDEETREDAVDALIEEAQRAIERAAGKKSKTAALKALVQVHAKLAGVDISSAGVDTYPALAKQATSIKELLAKLEIKLAELKTTTEKRA